MFCSPINLPNLEKENEQKIIDIYFSNIDNAKHPLQGNFKNYKNLHSFKDQTLFFSNIFKGKDINSRYFDLMSIQRTTGTNFMPHIDVHRKVSAIYTIRGSAETIFYREQDTELIPEMKTRMELSKWYLFDNSTYHAVFGIAEDRISLVINLSEIFSNFQTALDFFSKNTNS